jgi:hypothetical protein
MEDPAGDGPEMRARRLCGLFGPPELVGVFRHVAPEEVPEPQRSLLHHTRHMTATQERFHGGLVELRVLAATGDGRQYAREILLVGPHGRLVQHGVVRIDLEALPAETAARVVEAGEPLGRILAQAGIYCEIGEVDLLEVEPGPRLAEHAGRSRTWGRVARILIDDAVAGGGEAASFAPSRPRPAMSPAPSRPRPAIELLEIVFV